jgi:hypothetical protein
MSARTLPSIAVVMSVLALTQASAQTPGGPGIARTREGRPDFTGIWQVMNTAAWDIQDHQAR